MTTERDELEQSERLTAGATASPADLPDTTAEAHPSEPDRGRYGVLRVAMQLLRIGPLLILLILIAAMALLSPFFLTTRNLGNVLARPRSIAVLAMGQLLVILTRGHRPVGRLDPGAGLGRRRARLRRRRLRRRS